MSSEGGSALMGFGMFMQGMGRATADWGQAEAERANAGWFREQANFAAEAGKRKLSIFQDQSKILQGDQLSAFAKAGIDTSASAWFIANTTLQRDKEYGAIKAETDFNVRQAQLRASEADKTAQRLDSSGNTNMWIGTISAVGSLV